MMAQQSTPTSNTNPLYPPLESLIAPIDEGESNQAIVKIEKDIVDKLKKVFASNDILEEIGDRSVLPPELFSCTRRVVKHKLDPLKRLKELPPEEAEDEEDSEDEEEEDEELVEDEEEDAGGDYLVSYFDNGENYEDNDEEGDDMTI